MSTKYRVLCGVPIQDCRGSNYSTDQQLSKKAHSSHEEAFKCYANYLMNVLGYTQIGSREFRKEGHPVLVLTKKIRFGGRLRAGKEGTRYMPSSRAGTRGIIIG